ncbi:RNA-directed DNA polymerase, partial [Chloroflexota bacterium]
SMIWPIAALIDAESVSADTINQAIRIIEDSRKTVGLRGVATHLVGKHGNAGQRRLLRHIYDREPSEYVRAAILFSTKYFPTDERNSCLRAWGTHSTTNSLIANALRAGAE